MFPPVALAALFVSRGNGNHAGLQFDLQPDKGLTISVDGMPVVKGSWVQYYDSDWSHTYYNSTNSAETVQKLPNGDLVLIFKSLDGRAYGTEQFSPLPDGVKASYTLGWTGDKPVSVELTAGVLWTDALDHGSLTVDGKPVRSLQPTAYQDDDIKSRLYASKGKEFAFDAPVGRLFFQGSTSNWTCFDARNLNKNWSKGQSLFWLGDLAVAVKPNDVANIEAEWHFQPKESPDLPTAGVRLAAAAMPDAERPAQNSFVLIPQPKVVQINPDQPMEFNGDFAVDGSESAPGLADHLVSEIKRAWLVSDLASRAKTPRIFMRVQNLGLPAEGYEIRINSHYAMLLGQDAEGLRHAADTLVQLAFARDGKLCLPSGIIRDWPSVAWRGVHLFVGPQALEFHQKLWDDVLGPLKFNKVVLECEQTAWNALPSPRPAGYMSKRDLAQLFEFYRDAGAEPIPLIQSFGHMDWLFADKGVRDLALTAGKTPSIDPRIPAAKKLLNNVWDEAIGLLHPSHIHFGLDEVEVKWPTKDPSLMTQLWQLQLYDLAMIAQRHDVGMMCWGDQCLAPGEAPDAALADSKKEAAVRRTAIPKGAMVTDWHYKDDPRPEQYMDSLELWKSQGAFPIAAAWFRPENIRGFYLAAVKEGAGTLQTTWVGRNSSEQTIFNEMRQYAAFVVAADYAWSGRQDDWDKLGYDPYEVFSRMYFRQPSPLSNEAGTYLAGDGGVEAWLGQVKFKTFPPLALRSMLSDASSRQPEEMSIETPGLKGADVYLAMDTVTTAEEKQALGSVEVDTDGGSFTTDLVYGKNVRSTTDAKADILGERANGLSLVQVHLSDSPQEIRKIVLKTTSSYAGLRLHGVTAI